MRVRRDKRKPKDEVIKFDKILPDTSAIIHGKLTSLAEQGELKGSIVILLEMVMGELQSQASRGLEVGFLGLDEVKKLRANEKKYGIRIESFGKKATYEDIRLAKSGRIDALIQEAAQKLGAVLITCDLPQALVAEAAGIRVKYFESYEKAEVTRLEKFFTPNTMSVHLKEGCVPLAKKGQPGKFKLVPIREEEITSDEIDLIQTEIMDAAKYEEDAFIEMGGRHGATVIQLRRMRIAVARPPFSEKLEITAVRPIVKLNLEDYRLSDKLKERLAEKAEGVLISGSPGSGKSTFAASIAEFYLGKGKVVKTMENPRDLQVPKEITQYGPLDKSFARTAEILLLVRPDYTIFDEVRRTKDFEVFADMRLAGIGMVGVVHSSEAIDAVQRFIGRIELGVIPSVVDTIIYIKDGIVAKVLSLKLTVRVPSGMTEADLARPIVDVRDFETGNLEHEIYTYGDQTVVMPVQKKKKQTGFQKLAADKIKKSLAKFQVKHVEFLSENKVAIKVPNAVIARLIGKKGKNIKKLEEKLGVRIEVEPETDSLGKEVHFDVGETGAYMVLDFGKKYRGKSANIHVDGEYLFSATIGREGQIKVAKSSELGKGLIRAVTGRREIKVFI